MNEEVIVAGLTDDNVSSRVSLDSILSVEAKQNHVEDIEIPSRYYRNCLKILPVNIQTIFVYWEVTDVLLKDLCVNFPLLLKIFDQNGANELLRIGIDSEIGSAYLNAYWSERKLVAQIGYIDNIGDFNAVLSSGELLMPSDQLHFSDSSTWLNKKEKFEEIVKSSIGQNMPSSSSIMSQLNLEAYDARVNSLSSLTLAK